MATVVGRRGRRVVFRASIPVRATPGGDPEVYHFPAYAPVQPGLIMWTATIEDDDPDADRATARTLVRPAGGHRSLTARRRR
jgi:hypothetical protein